MLKKLPFYPRYVLNVSFDSKIRLEQLCLSERHYLLSFVSGVRCDSLKRGAETLSVHEHRL